MMKQPTVLRPVSEDEDIQNDVTEFKKFLFDAAVYSDEEVSHIRIDRLAKTEYINHIPPEHITNYQLEIYFVSFLGRGKKFLFGWTVGTNLFGLPEGKVMPLHHILKAK